MRKLLKPGVVLLCCTLWAAYAETVKLGCGVEVATCFSYTHTCEVAIVQAIQTAKKRLWLAGYGFTSNNIAQAIKEAHGRGVQVHLVLDKFNLTVRYSFDSHRLKAIPYPI